MIQAPILRWHTQDGNYFDTEEAALRHNKTLETREQIAQILECNTKLMYYECEAVARELVARRREFIAILQESQS